MKPYALDDTLSYVGQLAAAPLTFNPGLARDTLNENIIFTAHRFSCLYHRVFFK